MKRYRRNNDLITRSQINGQVHGYRLLLELLSIVVF